MILKNIEILNSLNIYIFAEYENSTFMRVLVKYLKERNYELHGLEVFAYKESGTYCATFSIKVENVKDKSLVINEMKDFDGLILLEELIS